MQETNKPNESTKPASEPETTESSSLEPTDKDIVFGRGKKYQDHQGNKRMRECINEYKQLYNALKRFQKQALVETIYEKLVEGGARFLRKDEANDTWELVDRELATQKVSHALRCKKHLGKSPKKIQDAKKKKATSPSSPIARKDSSSSTIETSDSARPDMASVDSTPASGSATPTMESVLSTKTVAAAPTTALSAAGTAAAGVVLPPSIAGLQVLQTLQMQDMLYQQQMQQLAMMNLQRQAQQQAYYNAAMSQLLGIRQSAE